MVKQLLSICLLTLFAWGSDPYSYHCVSCHKGMTISLEKFFMRYALKYSSEKEIKRALFDYMKNPSAQTSILEPWLIRRIGVKKPSTLEDTILHEAIDRYFEEYDISKRLK